eukprot:4629639-Amphidinium_carterae.1
MALQNQRIVLPTPHDLLKDVIQLCDLCSPGEDVQVLILDISDAFYLVPLMPSERKFTTARLNLPDGPRYFVFLCPPQGTKNAPQ